MAAAPPVRGAAGIVLVVGAGIVWLTSVDLVAAAHPAYGVTLGAALLAGVALLAWAGARLRSSAPARGLVVATLLLVLSMLLIGALAWLRPYGPSPVAVAALQGTQGATVTETATRITLTPAAPRTGLVFQPGARVDARAYVPLLRQVAAQGYLVVIVKQPYGIGFLSVEAPDAIRRDHPEVVAWAVGGHSLGGVAAASYAASSDVGGLVLWASYPASSIADRAGLAVVSVAGSADGLATPAKVEAGRGLLPAATTYVTVDGGIHAFFGDYGPQAGDGTPAVSREQAQAQIVRATVRLLAAL